MKLKNWLTAAALTILPKYGQAAEQHFEQDTLSSDKIETLAPDSVVQDSIIINPKDLSPEELYQFRLEKLRESREDMLLLIAHFESIKANAYWDKVAQCYSIGYGFTRTIDGKPVSFRNRIKSEEELMDYWIRYTEDNMFPTMAQYLAVEDTDIQERAALGCTAFNTGAGIYGSKGEASAYAETLNQYFATRDSIYLNKALYTLNKYTKSKGKVVPALVKRRRVESDILAHKIMLVKTDTLADSLDIPENAIDLSQTIIGASVSIGELPESSVELATKIRDYNKGGYNYADTVKHEFSKPPVSPKYQVKTSKPKEKSRPTHKNKTTGPATTKFRRTRSGR